MTTTPDFPLVLPGDQYPYGQSTMDRRLAMTSIGTPATTGPRLTFFTASRTETLGAVSLITAAAASTGASMIKIGIYSADPSTVDGTLTLIAETPNDPSLLQQPNTRYVVATIAPYTLTEGQRYAVAIRIRGGTSGNAWGYSVNGEVASLLVPRINGTAAASEDLPAAINPATAITATSSAIYFSELLPREAAPYPQPEVSDMETLQHGWAVIPRWAAGDSQGTAAGSTRMVAFWAPQDISVVALGMSTGGTGTSGATLARLGLYRHDLSTNYLHAIGATANDTSLFTTGSTHYVRPLAEPVALTAGMRYAVAGIKVGGANWFALGRAMTYDWGGMTHVQQVISPNPPSGTDLPGSFAATSVGTFLPFAAIYTSMPVPVG